MAKHPKKAGRKIVTNACHVEFFPVVKYTHSYLEYLMQSKSSNSTNIYSASRQTNDFQKWKKNNEIYIKRTQNQLQTHIRIFSKRKHMPLSRLFACKHTFVRISFCCLTSLVYPFVLAFVQSIEAWNFDFEYVQRIIMWC